MMKTRDNSYKTRRALIGALLIMSLILLPLWLQAGIWYEDKLIVEQKAQDTVDLTIHANALTTNINQRFALLEGLYAFTLTNPTEEKLDANFDTFASGLYVSAEGIRNFAIAPDGVMQYVYPLEGNENVAGHDIINDERANVRADVQRAIDTRQIVLSGPYELRQGGLGLVARKALFVNDTFWGLVAMVIDMEPVLDKADLEIHSDQFIYVGIRDEDGNVFYGDSQAFDSQPVTQQIELPDGDWELAQAPIYGWGALVRDEVLIFKGTGLVIVGLITILAYLLINRQSRLAYLVRIGTHELSEANDELKNDIIKRQQAEDEMQTALQKLEELELIINKSQVIVFLWRAGEKWPVEFVSDNIEQFGYTPQDFTEGHIPYADIIHNDDLERVGNEVAMYSEQGVAEFRQEYRIITKSGDIRWTDDITWVRRNQNGNITHYQGVVLDITERKKTELALQKSEELYRHLVELSPDGIIVHDLEKYTFVNNAAARILGAKNPEELIGRRVLDFIHPEYMHIAKQRLREEKDGKMLPFIEEKMLKIDGTSVDVEVAAFPATHMGAIEVHAIVRDITERKHAQEELIQSETKFRNYFEKGVVGVAITSPEKGWVEVNDYLCELFGYTNDEIVTKTWAEMTYPDDLAPDVEQFNRMLSGKIDSYSMEKRFIHKNGSIVSTIMSVACVRNETGDVDYYISSIQDISKLKQVENEIHKLNEELEQRVKARTADLNESQQALMSIVEDLGNTTTDLENANQRLLELDHLKSMFIASTSHELRTPLNSIIGFTSILLEGWSGELNPEQKEQLDIVHTSGQHLLSLINDVIDISKIEAGKIGMYMEEFNLKDVVNEAVSIVMPQINDKKLTLTVDVPDISMNTDYRRLLQCIINLLSNAIKFAESGDITLTTKTINNIVDISIMDTGIGIKENDLPRLFTAFTRLESPLTTKTPGTGLGLYLTQKLVEEVLGGTIDVKSTYGEGSRFTLHIPIKQEEKT